MEPDQAGSRMVGQYSLLIPCCERQADVPGAFGRVIQSYAFWDRRFGYGDSEIPRDWKTEPAVYEGI